MEDASCCAVASGDVSELRTPKSEHSEGTEIDGGLNRRETKGPRAFRPSWLSKTSSVLLEMSSWQAKDVMS